MKISSFEDLIQLSFKFHEFSSKEKLLCTNYASFDPNSQIINVLYRQLNEIQKKCFLTMHNSISNQKYSITLLDSRPGTGKSHLMASFSLSCQPNMLFVVYKQELVDYMQRLPYWDCFTAAKFKMQLFQLNSYKNFFSKYENTNTSIDDILIRIFILTKMIDVKLISQYDVIIIDEYTVLNPEMLLVFCFMAIVFEKHIIFCGDKCQQNSIEKSSQSRGLSNFHIIQQLATSKMSLNRIMRCSDDTYNKKLDVFREMIEHSAGGSTPLNYHHAYTLYILFKNNFYNDNIYDGGCYFAMHHKMLTEYTKKFKDYLMKNNKCYKISRIQNKNNDIPDYDEKFYFSLILVPGMTYIYNKKKHPLFGQYKLLSYTDDTVTLCDPKNNKQHIISPTKISIENVLDAFYERLNSKFIGPFFQYPLTPLYTSTYHNAQGLTLNSNIDLNTTRATCESIYVGLSRIKSERQLNKIEVDQRLLKSLEYTHNMNDEFYYVLNEDANGNDFKEIDNTQTKYKKNYKIKKINYEISTTHEMTSPLIQTAKSIKYNTTNILEKYHKFKIPNETNLLKSNLGSLLLL